MVEKISGQDFSDSWRGEKFCATWYHFRAKDTCPPISGFSYVKHPNNQTRMRVGKVMAVKERIKNKTRRRLAPNETRIAENSDDSLKKKKRM